MGAAAAYPIRWGANARPDVREYALEATQTFPWGAAVKLSSGEVIACVDDDVSILGFADEPAASVIVPGRVRVVLPNDQTEFRMKCSSTPAAANVYPTGGPYGLDVDANGDPILDLTDTTNDAFIITEIFEEDGTLSVYAKIIEAARQIP